MLTLNEVKESTSLIFDEGKKLMIPEPPIIWKDKLESLSAANLVKQRSSLIFDMRKWQAAQMGFKEIASADMVQMLMGEPHTETSDGKERQVYEWMYHHHKDAENTETTWGGVPTIFRRVCRQGVWYMPPFAKKIQWECQFGKLDYLKREIPYGVVLRINECKQLKLFNCFNVMAPMEAWERKTDIDPIVVGTIWEIPPIEKPDINESAGQVAHFFLAQW